MIFMEIGEESITRRHCEVFLIDQLGDGVHHLQAGAVEVPRWLSCSGIPEPAPAFEI